MELLNQGQSAKSRPLPEAQLLTLGEALEAYLRPCRFMPGDFVSAKVNSPLLGKGADYPYVVLEVVPAERACGAYGARHDVRLAFIDDDGDVMALWAESWFLEPYVK
jgi:hypothetical protein